MGTICYWDCRDYLLLGLQGLYAIGIAGTICYWDCRDYILLGLYAVGTIYYWDYMLLGLQAAQVSRSPVISLAASPHSYRLRQRIRMTSETVEKRGNFAPVEVIPSAELKTNRHS